MKRKFSENPQLTRRNLSKFIRTISPENIQKTSETTSTAPCLSISSPATIEETLIENTDEENQSEMKTESV